MRPNEVFKKTGIKVQSQHTIITRWRRRKFVILRDPGRRGNKYILTQEQIDWATSITTLQAQAHLTLE